MKDDRSIESKILYEDNHLIIINKSSSDIVQGDKTDDEPLSEVVKSYLKVKYNKPGEVFLGVVHRLDRPVSGVVIFAKTSKALSRMNELLRNNELQKTYWAITAQKPDPEQNTLHDFLKKNETQNKSYIVKPGVQGAKEAKLSYKLLARGDRYYLLEIALHTGRHHQIRAQLAHNGTPIKGDMKYGFPTSNKDGSISLHARSVSFIHPIKKELLTVSAPTPKDSLWNYFLETQQN
ncbi:MAG: RluA family pseudouridine synthase [Bacteroidales bacterium]|jgi:23S rRNA pseudouridine1911/1915/1917 synthase|nr:RluA family pseudouridine synthase [Bacteroidales bacterium]